MNTPRTHRSSRSRRSRKLSAAFGSLGLATTLAFSGLVGEGVTETEAAWTDTEAATAEVKAAWLQGFTRVTNASWKTRNERNYEFPSNAGMGGPHEIVRDFGLTYPQIGSYALATGNNDDRTSFGINPHPDIVPDRPTGLLGIGIPDAWMGSLSAGTDPAKSSQCMSFPNPSQIADSTSSCGVQGFPAARLFSFHRNLGFTYAIEASDVGSKRARVNASGFQSIARCNADGSSSASIIQDNDSVLELARGTGVLGNAQYDRNTDIREVIPGDDNIGLRFDGTTNTWARFNVEGTGSGNSSFVLAANVRKNTYEAPYYALAEMDLVIQVYSAGGGTSSAGVFIDQINLPLTRAECGFSDGTEPLPEMAGTFRGDDNQLGWPAQVWTGSVPDAAPRLSIIENGPDGGGGTIEPAVALTIRGLREVEGTATGLPPMTTVTSPTEHTTASETTTSAPPKPGDESQSTSPVTTTSRTTASTTTDTSTTKAPTATTHSSTSAPTASSPSATTQTTTPTTSAAPAIVVPDEPADLAAVARTAEVGIAKVDGEELVVVVKGDELPADARQGVAALEIWLGGGNPDSIWETFASDDPGSDGWRWAAINQETGTVVYIR